MAQFNSDEEALAAVAAGRKIEIVRNYPGHEQGIRHGAACAHKDVRQGTHPDFTPECIRTCYVDDPTRPPSKMQVECDPVTGEVRRDEAGNPVRFTGKYGDDCYKVRPLYMETTYEGAVLDTGEMNYHDDSDFYAVVFDGEIVKRVEYASTRGWCYPNSASVDATPEVRAAAAAYLKAQAIVAWNAANEAQAKKPAIGKVARVVCGKHKGSEGPIFYCQERRSRYGTWGYGTRLGIALSDRRDARNRYVDVAWVNADSVEVIDWQSHLKDTEAGEQYAEQVSHNPRGATAVAGMAFL